MINNPNELLRNAQIRFDENKDNPMVQGLIKFITSMLRKSLDDVASWSIELPEPDEEFNLHSPSEKALMQAMYGNIRRFTVQFSGKPNNWGVRGWLREKSDGAWNVWQFQHTYTVSNINSTITTSYTSVAE